MQPGSVWISVCFYCVYSRGDRFSWMMRIGRGRDRTEGSIGPGSSMRLLRKRWFLWDWPGLLFLEGLARPDEFR